MLAQLFGSVSIIHLVPFSGLQFLDFGFNVNSIRYSALYRFKPDADDPGRIRLLSVSEDEESGELLDSDGDPLVNEEEECRVNIDQILQAHDRTWLPLPVLRVKEVDAVGRAVFDAGPFNWVRIRVTRLDVPDGDGNTHRVTLVVDTNLLSRHKGRPYAAPAFEDVPTASQFALACELSDVAWMNDEIWCKSMIENAWDRYLLNTFGQAQFEARKRRMRPLEPWAVFVAMLGLLNHIKLVPTMQFIDTISEPRQTAPINVDFALDMGNSSTCGILIESSGSDQVDLNNGYSLELRDLSNAERVYSEPFPSRIEFHREVFGNNRFTMRSRGDAFQWPTPARIGWEAVRLSHYSKDIDGCTGLSSPKRYLWDTREQEHEWHFNAYGRDEFDYFEPAIKGGFFKYITNQGEEWIRDDPESSCVTRAKYSRSSMMMFFLAEVFVQALVQINSFRQRHRRQMPSVPRRLNRIVLTMPTAMTVQERMIFERRARQAWKICRQVMCLHDDQDPEIIMRWDEATGTQAVFLYNEIKNNFRGDLSLFFKGSREQFGKERSNGRMRIASLDIGGGTSDLIITTYQRHEGRSLVPRQEFREGFNIAGDDILRAIIERHVLPSIEKAVEQAGILESSILMTKLFGASRANEDEREHAKRRQFVHQISIPVALRILGLYEHYDPIQGDASHQIRFDDVFESENWPLRSVTDYIRDAIIEQGGDAGFDITKVVFNIDLGMVDNTVHRTIGSLISDMCELVHLYSCDYLLLSGRPSMMPGVQQAVYAKIPLPLDRVITMHDYKVGTWYPFRDSHGYLSDPKTTASVGALICSLSMWYLIGFHLLSCDMEMRSTANFIGLMEDTGQIKDKNLYFRNLNLDQALSDFRDAPNQYHLSTSFKFNGPMFIGFRQLGVERWRGAPLFRVDFDDPARASRYALPLEVTIGLIPPEEDRYSKVFDVQMVVDADGQVLRNGTVRFRLQTMVNDEGHWMDTGALLV